MDHFTNRCGFSKDPGGGGPPPRRGKINRGLGREAAAEPAEAIHLERVTLRDPAVDNIESHALLVPRGWTLRGGPFWTPQTFRSFVHLQLRITAPDGREVSVYPGMFYSYVKSPLMPSPPPGTIDNGTIVMPVPSSMDEYVARLFMPQHRPQARNVRVVQSIERPDMRQALEEMARPDMEFSRQSDMMMGTKTTFRFIAVRVRVSYDENGRAWEEDLYLDGSIREFVSFNMGFGTMSQATWWMADTVGLRARAGALDQAQALLEPIRVSIRRTPPYASLLSEINRRLLRQETDAVVGANQIWRQHQQEIRRMHEEAVAARQAASDRAHRKFINYIRDVQDYKMPDGRVIALPASYKNVYMNDRGDFIVTNNVYYNRPGWTQLERD